MTTRLVRVMVAKSRMKQFQQRIQRVLDYRERVQRVVPAGKHQHPGGAVYDTADTGAYAVNGERLKRAQALMSKAAGGPNILTANDLRTGQRGLRVPIRDNTQAGMPT